jgi:hypothetical protein
MNGVNSGTLCGAGLPGAWLRGSAILDAGAADPGMTMGRVGDASSDYVTQLLIAEQCFRFGPGANFPRGLLSFSICDSHPAARYARRVAGG